MNCSLATPGFALLGFVAVLGGSGCGATCERNPDDPPVPHTDGITDLAAGFYESSPVEGPYLNFPAGRTYQFFHGLGATPRLVTPYLSFDRCPLPKPCEPGDDDSSNFTEGLGNQAIFEDVNDEFILMRNDTCSQIFLRVTALAPEGWPAAAGDGGS